MPVSRQVCLRCRLPDTDHLCSRLRHPRIGGGLADPRPVQVLCDLGLPEATNAPHNCFIGDGGHACATYVVPETSLAPTAPGPPGPLAVAEGFDHLDVVWRLVFGRRLMAARSLKTASGLSQNVTSRDELDARLSDLAELIDSMDVGEQLVDSAGEKIPGSLNRLDAFLASKLDEASLDRARAGIQLLRVCVTLRVGAQHTGAAKRLPGQYAKLGLTYPAGHTAVWDTVRHRCIEGLAIIREQVHALAPA